MTETKSQDLPTIRRTSPEGRSHPLANQKVLDRATENMGRKQQVLTLLEFLIEHAKVGEDPFEARKAHNPHKEELIIRKDLHISVVDISELRGLLKESGEDVEILGLHSIGNPNQKVTAVVQGVDRDNPKSGYERPTVAEGPHMIIAPYAIDEKGELHIFRIVQFRQGEAVIDTPRGFADKSSLEGGKQMYEVEGAGERVKANLTRIVGEEAGKQLLQIRGVNFLGTTVMNTTFVSSKSALFGVEVDYNNFVQSNKVVSDEEFQRRREQFEHEGITGIVLDMPLDQYVNYKRDSNITSRDAAADSASDTVVIDFLAKRFKELKKAGASKIRNQTRAKEILRFKREDPEGYRKYRKLRADLRQALKK